MNLDLTERMLATQFLVQTQNCTFLQHVLNETLRFHAVVPQNARRAQKDTTLPQGGEPDGKSRIFTKKGPEIEYSVYVMHRTESLWGDYTERSSKIGG
jgi:cytochrome P450